MESSAKYPRFFITLASCVIVIAALYLGRTVLIPLALATLVSFLLAPLVHRLQHWHFPRLAAVIAALLLVSVSAGSVTWLVAGQIGNLVTRLPEYREGIAAKVASLRDFFVEPIEQVKETAKDLSTGLSPEPAPEEPGSGIATVRVAEEPQSALEVLGGMLSPTLEILVTGAMAVLFAFVMLLSKGDLADRFMRLAGDAQIFSTTQALNEASKKVSTYLARLLLLNGLHGVVVAIGLALIGVRNPLVWGLLSTTLRFIPYVGPWIAASLPILTSLATSEGWSQPLLTIGLFAALELVSNNLLEPWIYGSGTGISPLAILVSTLFWTWLWGPVGLVLSTPLTVCLIVMGKYVPRLHFLYLLFGDAPALPPPARLYQRMIAGDQDEAWSVLEPELRRKPLHEVYDSIVLPALSMAEHDRKRGALFEDSSSRIEETLKLLLEDAGLLGIEGNGAAAAGAERAREGAFVLCLPARGSADALAANMLANVLRRDGIEVKVAPLGGLVGESLALIESRPVDIVCVSAMPPSRFLHARVLCKRIAARHPGLPIVVGMWTAAEEFQDLMVRLAPGDGVKVVSSLEEARKLVKHLAESVRGARYRRADDAATVGAYPVSGTDAE